MSRATFGKLVRDRAKRLFEAILACANGEIEDNPTRGMPLEAYWQTENQLVVRTKLRLLKEITAQCGSRLEIEQIREALNRLEDIGILEDNRTLPKGSEIWHFTLKLRSKDREANLKQLDAEWERYRIKKSKIEISPVSTAPEAITCDNISNDPQVERDALRLRPYCNLPRQTYPEFIGRETELNQLLKYISLNYRAPIITVDGIGGVGKTALVLEAAYQSWEAKHSEYFKDLPIFDAIIFSSAKESYLLPDGLVSRLPMQNTLRDIFEAIAITLDDPKITQATPCNQLSLVYESLSKQKTLLIVDNMETMSLEAQDEVLGFLCDLPASVKAVITTRKRRLIYAPIRLDSLPEADSYKLIEQQATEKGVTLSSEESQALYERFGGVPVALIYAIGQLASGYSPERVLDRSTPLPDDIANFCFERSVREFRGQPVHKLLMSMAIFRDAPVKDVLIEVAQLKAVHQSAVDDSLAQLYQLSLVRPKSGRYEMLSLTREYAKVELVNAPDFEKKARESWIEWYLDFAKKYGQKDRGDWYIQYDRLQEEWGNILAVLYWCAERQRYADIKNLWQYLNDYAHFYGYWEERNFWLDWLIQASQRCGDLATLVDVLRNKGFTLTRQGGEQNLEAADNFLAQAWELHHHTNLRGQRAIANHISHLRLHQKQYEEALRWLDINKEIVNNVGYDEKWRSRDLTTTIYLEAQVYHSQNQCERAAELFRQVIKLAEEIGWFGSVNYAQNWLAEIAIAQGNLEEADKLLKIGLPVAERNKDRRRIACYQAAYARLEKARGNLQAVREWAKQAEDGFKRLGMKRKAEEMRDLLDG